MNASELRVGDKILEEGSVWIVKKVVVTKIKSG